MNVVEKDVLNILAKQPFTTQRDLAKDSGYSLGNVNRALKQLVHEEYLFHTMDLTDKALDYLKIHQPKRAIILAAGYGMRMVPINMETPKGLVEVNGEPLIERLIRQLHEVDIFDIKIVVGFMKEQYEYLMDEFNVDLIVNPEYAQKNNLHSLSLASDYLDDAYIVPCDIWCRENPFSTYELYSWYMVREDSSKESRVRMNRKRELRLVATDGQVMMGLGYLTKDDAVVVRKRLAEIKNSFQANEAFWEDTLYDKDRMIVMAKLVREDDVYGINTYEQLRELDENSHQLRTEAIEISAKALKVPLTDIKQITVLKKGMTNRSFLFTCHNKQYIMRIPGEGTDQLINRREEADVYCQIAPKHLCDDVIYMNPDNGYKITAYLEGARCCDAENEADVRLCMKRLRAFHEMELQVDHRFDIFGQLEFYETLWNGNPSVFKDYQKTKERIFELKSFVEQYQETEVLTHIDAVPDNFLMLPSETGEPEIRLIDWEYAGMQDPHVDLAMFCIYSLYQREACDRLLDAYFEEGCPDIVRIKVYAYIAICGLLWSNWCEYKRHLGIEFGEYSLRQYRYAKDFYTIVQEEREKLGV